MASEGRAATVDLLRSLSRISETAWTQPPQREPAWQARATSRWVQAPPRTALRMARSLTPLQWQTITSLLQDLEPLDSRLEPLNDIILKMKFNIDLPQFEAAGTLPTRRFLY